jgi:hypothetical protein
MAGALRFFGSDRIDVARRHCGNRYVQPSRRAAKARPADAYRVRNLGRTEPRSFSSRTIVSVSGWLPLAGVDAVGRPCGDIRSTTGYPGHKETCYLLGLSKRSGKRENEVQEGSYLGGNHVRCVIIGIEREGFVRPLWQQMNQAVLCQDIPGVEFQ